MRKELETYSAQLQGFLASAGFGSDGTFNVNLQSSAVVEPVGSWRGLAHDAVPDGWFLCDGAQYSRATYAKLWQAIGTTYGAGNGTTTFNVPDWRGKSPIGVDPTKASIDTVGKTTGTWDHAHSTPGHGHTISGATGDAGAYAPTLTVTTNTLGTSLGDTSVVTDVSIDSSADHAHAAGTLDPDDISAGTSGTANGPVFATHFIIKY
jgi:microcystin-dependent protein